MESFYAALLLVSAATFSTSLAAGLSFGNSTHVTDYAAFQRPGSVIEAYCAAPVGFDSSMLYFTLGSSEEEYSAAATPHFVSIVDRVKIKLTWPLNGSMADQTMYLYCRLRGQTDWPVLSQDQSAYVIYVNNGPSLVEEPLSCIATVKWTSSTGGQATVECNLTRSAHTRFNTAVNYSVYATAGTSLEVEEELLWTLTDSDPQNYAPEPLTFSFNRDSLTIISSDSIRFKVVLFERLSGRTVTAFQILRVLDSLTLPMDTLSWLPFSNGTGFVLTLHAGLLVRQCMQHRTYMAVVNVTASLDAGSVTSVTLLCDPCMSSGNCSVVLGGLVPAEHYSVALQQRLLSGEPASLLPVATPLPGRLLQLQPVHEFHVLTEEDAPRTGPEIHRFYQVLDCDQQSVAACRSCRQAAATTGMRSCQIVRIFWKDVPRRQANGQLRFYQVQLMRGPGTEKETLNFSAAARTAELFRHSNEELQVAVAGGTSKGLPPLANWSACIIPPDDAQSGALLPRGAMLSREPAAGKPCNVSWFLEPIADQQQPIEAMLLHCSSKADRCQEHSVVTMRRPWLMAKAGGWLPLERFAWSSTKLQSAGNDGGLCRDGALAVAIVSSPPPPPEERVRGGTTMSRLLEVDCRFLRQDDDAVAAGQALPKVTPTYADSQQVCMKWLPMSQSCGVAAALGLVVSLNVSLWSSDRSLLLEQRRLDGSATSHCFTSNVAEAETYYASLTWTVDDGLPRPRLVGPVEVRLRTPGLTTAAKSGVALGGAISGLLMVVGLIGCVRKVRTYRKTWRGNLTIPKIKIAAPSNHTRHSNLAPVSFLRQYLSPSEANQKRLCPEFALIPAELQSNSLRRWSSKDSAFASQDSSSMQPNASHEVHHVYGCTPLQTDCQHQESESSADVAGQVYTTFGGQTQAELGTSPSEFILSQNYGTPLIDDESALTYLPNEASLLLLVLASDSQGCDSVGSGDRSRVLGGCTSSSPFSDKCNGTDHASLSGEDHTFQSFLDCTTMDAVSNVQSSSLPSDYIRVNEGLEYTALPTTGFRCSACLDEVTPLTDYISISDALQHTEA